MLVCVCRCPHGTLASVLYFKRQAGRERRIVPKANMTHVMHRGSEGPSASSKSAYLPNTSTCLSVLFSRCDVEKATEAPTVVTFCDAETEAGCV